MTTIRFYSYLAEQLGISRLEMEIRPYATIYQILLDINNAYPDIFYKYFKFSSCSLETELIILINGISINHIDIINNFVSDGTEIHVMPAIYGG